ncbi:MAG: hypothetical protein ACYDA7_04170 [Acidithiobacillus sp.]
MWDASQFKECKSRRGEGVNKVIPLGDGFTISRLSYLVMTVPLFIYIWLFLKYTVNMPYSDDYDSVLGWLVQFLYNSNAHQKIIMLFRQHNEHRIVFDRVMELADVYLFGKVDFIYLDFIGLLGLLGLLGVMLYIAKRKGLKTYEVVPIPFLILTLSQSSQISFAMASMQQYWQLLFSVLSLVFLISFRKYVSFVTACVLAIIASFTGAGGLIVFPVGLIYLALSKKLRLSFLWSMVAAAIFYIYFIYLHYEPTPIGKASHAYAYSHPIKYVEYAVSFVGNAGHNLTQAFYLGCVLIVMAMTLFIISLRKTDQILTYISVFVLATAAAAGLSRVSMGIGEALGARYTIYSLLILSTLYIALISSVRQQPIRRLLTSSGILVSVALYASWIIPGLSGLNQQYGMQENVLCYPSQSSAMEELGNAMKHKLFIPVAQVYRNLPASVRVSDGNLYSNGYLATPEQPQPELPYPPQLSSSIDKDSSYKKAWAMLSKIYLSRFDVIYNFPLKSQTSYLDLLRWAESDAGRGRLYQAQYKAMAKIVAQLTPPSLLAKQIDSNSQYRLAWDELSLIYFSRPDLQKAFPLKSQASYLDLLRWAESDAGRGHPYQAQYKAMAKIVAQLPPPSLLAKQIDSNSQYRQAWDELSLIYFSRPDLQKAFPLNSLASYEGLLQWAGVTVPDYDPDSSLLRPFQPDYKSMFNQLK